MQAGNFVVILHTHLPYVLHHGDWPHGTDWICEAVAECYLPLLNEFHALKRDGITPNVTIDISPVLCEQLEHPEFAELFVRYCDTRVQLALADEERFISANEDPHLVYLARMWQQWYAQRKHEFTAIYKSSIVGALRDLQDSGDIEIMTCGATHAYLALVGSDEAVRFQVRAAVANYQKHFGCKPRGIWLPECAYRPAYSWRTFLPAEHLQTPRERAGIEQILAEEGLQYFVSDEHAIRASKPLGFFSGNGAEFVATTERTAEHPFDATPMSIYHVASGTQVEKGTAIVFTRDQNIAMQVWSGDKGYPGDPSYLDFHKKHHASALRYWRVTDSKADMQYKLLYVPEWTRGRIRDHAFHFTQSIERTAMQVAKDTSRPATICTPFDTELFGHWWFEGPAFVGAVLRGLAASPFVHAVCASEHIRRTQPREVVSLPESSWGKGGHHEVWMNDGVKYMWESLYSMEALVQEIVPKIEGKTKRSAFRRVVLQMLREFMLAQASDWEFLVSTHSAEDYAKMRFHQHREDFFALASIALELASGRRLSTANEAYVAKCESRNAVFAELDPGWWS
jgi:1,4-alpha-glucan branching enzyme